MEPIEGNNRSDAVLKIRKNERNGLFVLFADDPHVAGRQAHGHGA